MSIDITKAQDFIYNISIGLGWCRYISIWKIIGDYIITKHQPHMEYLDGTKMPCNTAYKLFKYNEDTNLPSHCQDYVTKALKVKEVNDKTFDEWKAYIETESNPKETL